MTNNTPNPTYVISRSNDLKRLLIVGGLTIAATLFLVLGMMIGNLRADLNQHIAAEQVARAKAIGELDKLVKGDVVQAIGRHNEQIEELQEKLAPKKAAAAATETKKAYGVLVGTANNAEFVENEKNVKGKTLANCIEQNSSLTFCGKPTPDGVAILLITEDGLDQKTASQIASCVRALQPDIDAAAPALSKYRYEGCI